MIVRKYVIDACEALHLDRHQVGGKAANLARLAACNLPVPAFVVVMDSGDRALERLEPHLNRLTEDGARLLAVRSSSPEEDGDVGSRE